MHKVWRVPVPVMMMPITVVMGRVFMRMMMFRFSNSAVMVVRNGRMGKHQQIRCEKTE